MVYVSTNISLYCLWTRKIFVIFSAVLFLCSLSMFLNRGKDKTYIKVYIFAIRLHSFWFWCISCIDLRLIDMYLFQTDPHHAPPADCFFKRPLVFGFGWEGGFYLACEMCARKRPEFQQRPKPRHTLSWDPARARGGVCSCIGFSPPVPLLSPPLTMCFLHCWVYYNLYWVQ